MLPDDTTSAIALPGAFYDPDSRNTRPLIDWERGGVALNNTSQGLLARNWRGFYVVDTVYVEPESGSPIALITVPNIEELSFCFDQNMRPAVCYRVGENLFLWWYDSLATAHVTTAMGTGRNPRLAMDDKRAIASSSSDIIFAYIRGSTLYYRQQRDRFNIERALRQNIPETLRLVNMGLSTQMRFQFELV